MSSYWRVYFWAYLALTALSVLGAALRPAALAAIDWVDLAAFTPVALFAVGAQAFSRSVLPTNLWKGLLFAAVFWKSIALGVSVPKVIARGVDMNAKVGLGAAELTIAPKNRVEQTITADKSGTIVARLDLREFGQPIVSARVIDQKTGSDATSK